MATFGADFKVVVPYTEHVNQDTGRNLVSAIKFSQEKSDLSHALTQAASYIAESRSNAAVQDSETTMSDLLFIISDGRNLLEPALNGALARIRSMDGVMPLVILIDHDPKNSLEDVRVASFKDNKLEMKSYLQQLPFPFYILLREWTQLPEVVSSAVEEWIQMVSKEP